MEFIVLLLKAQLPKDYVDALYQVMVGYPFKVPNSQEEIF